MLHMFLQILWDASPEDMPAGDCLPFFKMDHETGLLDCEFMPASWTEGDMRDGTYELEWGSEMYRFYFEDNMIRSIDVPQINHAPEIVTREVRGFTGEQVEMVIEAYDPDDDDLTLQLLSPAESHSAVVESIVPGPEKNTWTVTLLPADPAVRYTTASTLKVIIRDERGRNTMPTDAKSLNFEEIESIRCWLYPQNQGHIPPTSYPAEVSVPVDAAREVQLAAREWGDGTLTYEIVDHITKSGLGQSTCLGIGGDPVIGTKFIECLELFVDDKDTEAVVLVGEIGGRDEQDTAAYVKKHFNKPVFGFIAGKTAPPGKRMGHAGAIIAGTAGTAAEKIKAFEENGIKVGETPADVARLLKEHLK